MITCENYIFLTFKKRIVMSLIEDVELLERIICLIRKRSTGDAEEFASKLGKSERTVHRLLGVLKDEKLPIKYCSKDRTYYFDEEVKYEFRISVGGKDLLNIKGGRKSSLDLIGFENL